jgi:hypothetical protein
MIIQSINQVAVAGKDHKAVMKLLKNGGLMITIKLEQKVDTIGEDEFTGVVGAVTRRASGYVPDPALSSSPPAYT